MIADKKNTIKILLFCPTIAFSLVNVLCQCIVTYSIYDKPPDNNKKNSIYCEEKSDCDSDLEKRANVKIETTPNGFIVSIV